MPTEIDCYIVDRFDNVGYGEYALNWYNYKINLCAPSSVEVPK